MEEERQVAFHVGESSSHPAAQGDIILFDERFMRVEAQLYSLGGKVSQISSSMESLTRDVADFRLHHQDYMHSFASIQ